MPIRRLMIGFLLFALCLTNVSTASAQEYSYARVVRLSLVEGDVQVLRPESDAENAGWEEALLNLPIRQSYTLSSARGRVEVEFESGATARLADYSALEFTELALADGNRLTRMLLQRGTATFYANLSRGEIFIVSTPDLQVEISRSARFRVDALATGTAVTVLKGEANVYASAGSYRVTKGQTLLFQEAATEKINIARNREMDDWDRWVADREDAIETARSETQRYLNAPVRYGLASMSGQGSWFVDSSYGYVWQPYGIGAGWSPYWLGRWVFLHGHWTWVSYESWGWLPYHYGRWALTRHGWVWIPGGFNSWHPGLVGWLQFDGRVGWCPLGPRDRVGIAPHSPQGGVVVWNTPTGATGGSGHDVRNLDPDERPRFVDRPPLRPRNPRSLTLKDEIGDAPPRQGEVTGSTPGTGFTTGTNTQPAAGSGKGTELRPSDEPGIVYDPEEKRWVTNPRVPKRPVVEEGDRPAGPTFGRQPRDAGNAPGRDPRSDAPATQPRPGFGHRPGDAPPRSSEEPRDTAAQPPRFGTQPRPIDTPRQPQPRMDSPRGDSPRPSSPPRSEAPRSSPPPRMDSPRPSSPPSSPPPRVDTPRPSPSPSSGGPGASSPPPRQSPPPSPPPRSDPPKSGGRPNTH
jgi:hypothetical protein